MRAILTLIDGHRPDSHQAAADRARAEHDLIAKRYAAARERVTAQHGADALSAFDDHRQTAVGWSALRDVEPLRRDLAKCAETIRREEQLAAPPATADKIKIAAVDSYDQRDALKARGYRFDREAHWLDPAGAVKPLAGWTLTLPVSATDRLAEEIAWLRQHGTIEANTILNRLSETIRASLQD